jgi:hypothetical protein
MLDKADQIHIVCDHLRDLYNASVDEEVSKFGVMDAITPTGPTPKHEIVRSMIDLAEGALVDLASLAEKLWADIDPPKPAPTPAPNPASTGSPPPQAGHTSTSAT